MVKEITNKIKRIYQRPFFEFFFYLYKQKIKSITESVVSYPIYIDMYFNKEDWFNKYVEGHSISAQVLKKARNIERSMNKIYKKYPMEVYDRYYRMISKRQIRNQIRQSELELENLMKK